MEQLNGIRHQLSEDGWRTDRHTDVSAPVRLLVLLDGGTLTMWYLGPLRKEQPRL